jgi:transcription elongation factor GreA
MSTVAAESELITRAGHERLSAELERLLEVRRRDRAADLPSEREGLAGLAEDREALDRRIAELEMTLSRAQVAPAPPLGVAAIGQPIRIRIGGGGARDCQLVGAVEADPATGGISIVSPIGRALVGRRAGDVVEVLTPGGIRVVELVSVG